MTVSTGEFNYRLSWLTSGYRPGAHVSMQAGLGQRFRDIVPLINHPDPRRIDVRTSMSDPFENIHVRVYDQRSAIAVYVLADFSASMGYGNKVDLVQQFIISAAASSYAMGDLFGFIACHAQIHQDSLLPATRRRSLTAELQTSFPNLHTEGQGISGLLDAAHALPRQRSLVFIASDFHFPIADIDALMSALGRHDIVPVVIWLTAEYSDLPSYGFAEVRDLENEACGLLFLRPTLRKRFLHAYAERRRQLVQLLMARGREPFFLIDRFDPDRLTEYFLKIA